MKLKIFTISLIGVCKAPEASQEAVIMDFTESESRQSSGLVNGLKKGYGSLKAGYVALKNFPKKCGDAMQGFGNGMHKCSVVLGNMFPVLYNGEERRRIHKNYNSLNFSMDETPHARAIRTVRYKRDLAENKLKLVLILYPNQNLASKIRDCIFSESPTTLDSLEIRLRSLESLDQRFEQVRGNQVLEDMGDVDATLSNLCKRFIEEALAQLREKMAEQAGRPEIQLATTEEHLSMRVREIVLERCNEQEVQLMDHLTCVQAEEPLRAILLLQTLQAIKEIRQCRLVLDLNTVLQAQ